MTAFHYTRRVQFAETDLAGIVHFSWMFRYMEEAEHALWRAAGLSVAERGSDMGWPRVSAAFEFRNPLHFEDVVEVTVRLRDVGKRTLRYEHTLTRGTVVIGTGTMTAACVRKSDNGTMQSVDVPADIVQKLRAALSSSPGT